MLCTPEKERLGKSLKRVQLVLQSPDLTDVGKAYQIGLREALKFALSEEAEMDSQIFSFGLPE